jgi:hypothetical protein
MRRSRIRSVKFPFFWVRARPFALLGALAVNVIMAGCSTVVQENHYFAAFKENSSRVEGDAVA